MNLRWGSRAKRQAIVGQDDPEPDNGGFVSHTETLGTHAALIGKDASRRGQPEPLTEERLKELLILILSDIRSWSARYGYSNVPPIELLRQVAQLAEVLGRVTHAPESRR